MKSILPLAAVTVAVFGLASVLPSVARDHVRPPSMHGKRMIADRLDGPDVGRYLALGCAPESTERLELAFVRLSYRVTPTADQQPLFDALKSKALATQAALVGGCAGEKAVAGTTPDILATTKARLDAAEVRLAAVRTLMPEFEAFYSNLSDAQKALLQPKGAEHRIPLQARRHR